MSKVSASQLKARLGKYMKEVRAGGEVLVTDRDVLVARLVPASAAPRADALPVAIARDPMAPPLGKVVVRSLPRGHTDTGAWLREDRARR